MAYSDDDLLPLSGIQHFAFCPRQWALIHIESQWTESARTAQGRMMHEKADDPYERESRRDLLVSRAVPLTSCSLGLFGVADVVEFIRAQRGQGVAVPGHGGAWLPYPVEYKVGKPKIDERDTVQLCAQCICLEEGYGIDISSGYMYYGMPRRRTEVVFNEELRNKTKELADMMHSMFEQRVVPPVKKTAKCKLCSMREVCMPGVYRNVQKYLKEYMDTLPPERGE